MSLATRGIPFKDKYNQHHATKQNCGVGATLNFNLDTGESYGCTNYCNGRDCPECAVYKGDRDRDKLMLIPWEYILWSPVDDDRAHESLVLRLHRLKLRWCFIREGVAMWCLVARGGEEDVVSEAAESRGYTMAYAHPDPSEIEAVLRQALSVESEPMRGRRKLMPSHGLYRHYADERARAEGDDRDWSDGATEGGVRLDSNLAQGGIESKLTPQAPKPTDRIVQVTVLTSVYRKWLDGKLTDPRYDGYEVAEGRSYYLKWRGAGPPAPWAVPNVSIKGL